MASTSPSSEHPGHPAQRQWHRVAVVVVGVVFGGGSVVGSAGCDTGPNVTIALERGESLPLAPDFVRMDFHTKDETIAVDVAAVGALPRNAFIEIEPTVSFSVDVIGCPSNVAEECEDEAGFLARGCAGPFSRTRDQEAFTVTVVLEAPTEVTCPIEVE